MSDPLSDFLARHNSINFIDLLMPDINGIVRGKKIDKNQIDSAFDNGIMLPRSLYGTDVCGDTVDATRLGISTGDQDYLCQPEADTLVPLPWADGAQCMIQMLSDEDGRPYRASPRQVLRQVVDSLASQGLVATVAVELEFYLFQNQLGNKGQPQLLIDPVSGDPSSSTQVYSMDDLDRHRKFIELVQIWSRLQKVPASAAIAEYAPGQFEINLHHQPDAVAACDYAIYLKRIIHMAARKTDVLATFMAKPDATLTGSGMHVHVSICNEKRENLFAATPGLLQQAIGGCQQTMADAMLLFAPHANSYRRFRSGSYVPMSPCWGYNNRTVALRVPAGTKNARRIEHRVSGADANPYLVVAAVLAGIAHGVANKAQPDAPIANNAETQCKPTLPVDWLYAIDRFSASDWVKDSFGALFADLYTTIKRAEHDRYHATVPPQDIHWYLQTF